MFKDRLRHIIKEEVKLAQAANQEQLSSSHDHFREDEHFTIPKSHPQSTQFSELICRNFSRQTFDFSDLRQSTSRHRLLPMQKSALVSSLYKENGQVAVDMVMQFGSYLGLSLSRRKVEEFFADHSVGCLIRSRKPLSKQSNSDDSEPEEDEMDGRKLLSNLADGLTRENMPEIIRLLIVELNGCYRDFIKKELTEREKAQEIVKKIDIPSYEQNKGIADSFVEFSRMSRVRLFGSRHSVVRYDSVSQSSVMLSFPTLSIPSTAARTLEDIQSVSTAYRSSPGGAESNHSSTPLLTTSADLLHPLKNPNVFRHFYPSDVPDDTRKLPIFNIFDRIMSTISSRKVTVISGSTGTGKTTQVPLMILDQAAKGNIPCNIIVTQPRRLAAIGVARRVCADRNWTVGQLVGYHVGLDKKVSQSTRLTYCTTGVFIEKIVGARHLNAYTHVFLDEVHERDQDTDLSLMLVRQMLRENSSTVKVILMSATVEMGKMITYFQQNVDSLDAADQPGKVSIATQNYPVFEKYLDEFADRMDMFEFDILHPYLPFELMELAVRTLDNLLPVDGDHGPKDPAVLIFLPGLENIMEFATILTAKSPGREVMILHSTISAPDQERVLNTPQPGVQRVILSTNIAESSLTIPYIDYVFDFCLTKVLRLNRRTKVPQLLMEWASVSNCHQRRGRIGRVKKGRIYFFVPRQFFNELPLHPEPEILISPIEHSVLRVKLLKVAPPPAEVLILLPDPPNRNDVERAVLTLKQIGALTVKFDNQITYTDGELTAMGQLIARFPMDIRIAKFLILCCVFGYVQEGVTIASGMSVEGVFSNHNIFSPERCKRLHQLYSSPRANSDSIALLLAFERWSERCEQGAFKSRVEEKRWCDSQLIDLSRMREFVALRREVWHRLSQRGVFPDTPTASQLSASREVVLPLLLAGAFYPNILINQSVSSGDIAVAKELLGYDPLRSCMIARFGYASACQAPLYDAQLKELLGLNRCPDTVARIIYGSRETFVSFARHSGTSSLNAGYLAGLHRGVETLVKRMHNLRGVLTLRDMGESLDLKKSCALMDENRIIESDLDSRFCVEENIIRLPPPSWPCGSTERIPVVLSNIENIELLWLAIWDENSKALQIDLNRMIKDLTDGMALRPAKTENLVLFSSYLSRHKDDENEFSRVKLFGLPDAKRMVQILLVDIGAVDKVPANWLYVLPLSARSIPRACFEFQFAGIRFDPQHRSLAIKYVTEFVAMEETNLFLEIHSILDGVVRGIVFFESPLLNGPIVNLNDELVRLGYAYVMPESWISEYDHERRLKGPVVNFPSSYDVQEKPVPRTEQLSNEVHVGPVLFPARASLTSIYRHKMIVSVEPASLNSFSHDRHPEDGGWPYRPVVSSRLLHAGARDNRLKAHCTTVLPTQPGLLGLLTMIFAPYVELIQDGGEFIGALSGLGPYPGKTHSFYPDCEVELFFDGVLRNEDVEQANNLRAKINAALRIIGQDNPEQSSAIQDMQTSCVTALQSLFRKPRRLRPVPSSMKFEWKLTNHDLTDDTAASAFLVPVEFEPIPEETLANNFTNIIALHRRLERNLASIKPSETEVEETRCLLCNVQLMELGVLIAHIYSADHQMKEREVLGFR